MITPLQKQRQRDQAEIERQAKKKGKRLPGPPPPDVDARLANVARYVEPILAANSNMVETHRFVSLVDLMASKKVIPSELAQAAERFRELYLVAIGRSQGVSSYGEFQPGAPSSQRMPTTDKKMWARKELEKAITAAFAVRTNEGRWVVDQQLWNLIYPALINDGKNITQADIGRQRTKYEGRAQVGSAGGTVIMEALVRLSLHFGYRVE